MLCDGPVVEIDGIDLKRTVHIGVVGETHPVERTSADTDVNVGSERRTADYVGAAVRTVVDTIVKIIIDAVVGDQTDSRRQPLNAIAEVVRLVSVEVARTSIVDESTIARRSPEGVVVVVETVLACVAVAVVAGPVTIVAVLVSLVAAVGRLAVAGFCDTGGAEALLGDIAVGTDSAVRC